MLDFGFYNMDCMEGMKLFPDKFFDLAIVDPPYGNGNKDYDAVSQRYGGRFSKYFSPNIEIDRTGITWAKKFGNNINLWDVAPDAAYFEELFRVSKNQIIFGGNYFELPPTRCFIVWHKTNIPHEFSMAEVEYAWTSFNDNAKMVEVSSGRQAERFHPTQKPVKLYEWIIAKYAKDGDIILDTHAGSASSLIACHNTGHKFVGFELNTEYFETAQKRLQGEMAQVSLFDFGIDL